MSCKMHLIIFFNDEFNHITWLKVQKSQQQKNSRFRKKYELNQYKQEDYM